MKTLSPTIDQGYESEQPKATAKSALTSVMPTKTSWSTLGAVVLFLHVLAW